MATTSLKVIASQDDGRAKKKDMFSVNPQAVLEEDGFNLRDYSDPDVIAHIEEFADAYAAGRYVPPIMVRVADDEQIYVVEGHQRLRGAKLAIERGVDLKFLEAVQFRGNDTERVEVMLRSAEGLALKPLEIALGYLRLVRKGYEPKDIADKMSKSDTHVEQLLLLANANADVHALVRSKAVAAHVAIEVVRKHGEKAGAVLKDQLAAQQAQGKTKVTMKSIGGPRVPPKVMARVIGRFRSVSQVFEQHVDLAKMVESDGVDSLQGKTIEIDASQFYELMQANAEIVASLQEKPKGKNKP